MRGLAGLEPVEQALTRTEYHRADLKIDLIDQTGCDRLSCARGSSCDGDGASTGRRLGLGVGGVDPVGDEVKGGSAPHLDRLVWVMRQDEHRAVVGRCVAHQPVQSESPHSPRIGPNMLRPMMVAPTPSIMSEATCVLTGWSLAEPMCQA